MRQEGIGTMTSARPTTTKAVRIFEHGPEEVLRYGDYPLAHTGPTDILVRVAAASVSRWDLKYRQGLPASLTHPGRRAFPLPQQLGREAAGVVVEIGPQVTRHAVGDPVVGVVHPEDPHSVEAARGLGNLSPGVELPGHQALGGYAEYLVRDESRWLPVDQGVSLEQAAVALWPFPTSHRILHDRLRVGLGETVLVLGASGGMGIATLQLANLMGATAVATTRTQTKANGLAELGAHHVIVLDDADQATESLRATTKGRGVDHVIDFVGDHELARFAFANLRVGGRYCVAAGEGGGQLPFAAEDLIRTEASVLGIRGARRADALITLDLLAAGRIHSPIAARFALSEAAAAHTFLDHNRDIPGRVVLTP